MNIVKYTKEFSELAGKFDCGNSVINRFLISGDALNENQGITYVMLSDQKDFIIGYYNIEVGRVDLAEKYSLQGTTQGNGLTGGVPPVRFSM